MAVLQIKKHKVFLDSQATQYTLNISYQKRKKIFYKHTQNLQYHLTPYSYMNL